MYVGNWGNGEIPGNGLSRSPGLLRFAVRRQVTAAEETTMKSAVMTCLSALAALSMTGCPIYPSDNQCRSDWDCAPGYLCNENSGACTLAGPVACGRPADCVGTSETCAQDGFCRVGSCHLDSVGCVAGYTCSGGQLQADLDGGSAWSCARAQTPIGVGGSSSDSDAGSTGGTSAE